MKHSNPAIPCCAAFRSGKRCRKPIHETQTIVIGDAAAEWEMRLEVPLCSDCSIEADLATERIQAGRVTGQS